ncbi:hypothetical protein [Polaribacter sp. Hel1_85]|uniref:DUF7222 domain-containing protein n=1 Tax=Polaribacter sp. Hel1_85 TaxID=1250005 RepID=UPI00052CB8CC|nr:hypothetical protein [Polaribacter sp. Hel1_85]KGL62333.1 hypothetical protein PHEL85_2127 [Polaribacter sp. Hel1_85]
MSNLSKKDFLKNHSSFPEFHKKVLKQSGLEWKQLIEHPQDYYAANSGSVPGFIFYNDTVAFAKKHHLVILQILDEFESECGKLENKSSPQDKTSYYNWLAWFAYESMFSEIIAFVES